MYRTADRLTSEEITDFLEIISNNDRRLIALMKERAGRGAGMDTMPPALGDPDPVGLIVGMARSDTELAIADLK
jgi:hypothetical protein